jgi:hypothetical protein
MLYNQVFYSEALTCAEVFELVLKLRDHFIVSHEKAKVESSLNTTIYSIASKLDVEETIAEVQNSAGTHLSKKVSGMLSELSSGKDVSDQLFWCLESLFLRTGFFDTKRGGEKLKMAGLYALVTDCVYMDRNELTVSSKQDGRLISLNVKDRPLRVLSKFASSGGGGDCPLLWREMSGCMIESVFARSLRKVRILFHISQSTTFCRLTFCSINFHLLVYLGSSQSCIGKRVLLLGLVCFFPSC